MLQLNTITESYTHGADETVTIILYIIEQSTFEPEVQERSS